MSSVVIATSGSWCKCEEVLYDVILLRCGERYRFAQHVGLPLEHAVRRLLVGTGRRARVLEIGMGSGLFVCLFRFFFGLLRSLGSHSCCCCVGSSMRVALL